MKENFNSSSAKGNNNHSKNGNLDNKVICPLCDENITDLKEKINIHLEECFASSKFAAATTSACSSSVKLDTKFKRKQSTDENGLKNSKRSRTSSNSFGEGKNNFIIL